MTTTKLIDVGVLKEELTGAFFKLTVDYHTAMEVVEAQPEVDPFSCKGCVRDNELRWEDKCFECARYHHDWYKRVEQ